MHIYDVTLDNITHRIELRPGELPLVDGIPVAADLRRVGSHKFSVVWDGEAHTVLVAAADGGYDVFHAGEYGRATVETEKGRLLKQHMKSASGKSHRAEIHAPMPALVVKVEVSVGDSVTEGQGLIVLEAMKMENVLKAHQSGTVKAVMVEKGKAVEKGELLILLE
jgi:biotin carboxyl carrier protein